MSGIVMEFPDTVDEFMEQYGMTDIECVYSNGIEYVPIYRMKQWFEHLKVKPKTNGDCIRSMTDEELAEFFDNTCIENLGKVRCDSYGRCYDCMLDWLKEEAEHERFD